MRRLPPPPKQTTGQPFTRPLNEKGEMVPSNDHGFWSFTRYVSGAFLLFAAFLLIH